MTAWLNIRASKDWRFCKMHLLLVRWGNVEETVVVGIVQFLKASTSIGRRTPIFGRDSKKQSTPNSDKRFINHKSSFDGVIYVFEICYYWGGRSLENGEYLSKVYRSMVKKSLSL